MGDTQGRNTAPIEIGIWNQELSVSRLLHLVYIYILPTREGSV